MATYTFVTDAGSREIEADSADEAALRFAERESWAKGCVTLDELVARARELVEDDGGELVVFHPDGYHLARVV